MDPDAKMVNGLLRSFFSRHSELQVKKGETFLFAGDEPKGVYYVVSGHIREYDISARTGSELTLHIFNKDSFFPLSWAFDRKVNPYFFKAVSDTTLWVAPAKEVRAFLLKEPQVQMDVIRRLLHGLSGLSARLGYQVFGDSYTRVAAEVLYLGRHFGMETKAGVVLDERFTHQDIADLTGLVRETVSVAMEKLVSNGLLTYQGHTIIIPSPKKLEKEIALNL